MPEHGSVVEVERADGKTMAVRQIGQGSAVVCLAGGPGRDAAYLETLGELDGGFRLIIPDARGTGESPAPDTDDGFGFDQLAADIESLRTWLGVDQQTLLAHSAACTTAVYYASMHPRHINGLVLLNPGGRLYPEVDDDTEQILLQRHTEPPVASAINAWEELSNDPRPEEIPALLLALAPAFYGEWSDRQRSHAEAEQGQVNRSARELFDNPNVNASAVRRRLSDVEAPVLTVTGSKDGGSGIRLGDAWAECFPNGQHVTIERAGHFPWVDQPAEFSRAVTHFLQSASD